MPTNSARLRALYRSLLRELPPRPILARERSPLHRTLRASFSESSPATAHVDIDLPTQLLAYLRAQRMYAGLIERYNPGMGMDQDERVRLSARKVGMNLPVEFDPANVGRQ